uniref:Uncharacterized protein n=1 Tax=Glossina pallidipes TaxID=7398 RepID=A0A1A9Z471_GLOPL
MTNRFVRNSNKEKKLTKKKLFNNLEIRPSVRYSVIGCRNAQNPEITISCITAKFPPLKRSPNALAESTAICEPSSMPTLSTKVAAPTAKPNFLDMESRSLTSCRMLTK